MNRKTPHLPELEIPVHALAPDEGRVDEGKGRVWRVRSGLRAGEGEGTSQTDRSNLVES